MPAGRWNFEIEQGADFARTLTWLESDAEDADPLDLTGYTARMKIKDTAGALVLELTNANGRITLGGALGTIALALTAAVTGALTAAVGLRHDLELVSGGGTVTRLVKGIVSITPQVSD